MESIHQEVGRFFHPENVALIGASGNAGFGHGLSQFYANNGWGDRAYPVNPKLKEIAGLRVYPSVGEIPDAVDLACIMVPAPAVMSVFEECVNKGVKAVIVMSAGFSETGSEGARTQALLTARAREVGIRLMGPNCIGVVNVPHRFATCEVQLNELEPGRISIVAQSGVFGSVLMDAMPSQGVRIAKVATIGNRADLDEADFLEYLGDDPDTGVIVLYLESVLRGRRFLEVARRVSRKKPVLAYLGGQTEAGRKATMSHTGSLAGFGAVYVAAMGQAGIWIARDPQELIETAKVFAANPVPAGKKVVVVTSSGSLGVMAADQLAREGLDLAQLSPSSLERIRALAPAWMNLGNPLDVGPSGLFREAMTAALEAPDVDAVIAFPIIPWAVIKGPLRDSPEAVASMFVDRARVEAALANRAVIVSAQGHPDWKAACARFFGPQVPFVSTPQAAVRAMGVLYRYGQWRKGNSGQG